MLKIPKDSLILRGNLVLASPLRDAGSCPREITSFWPARLGCAQSTGPRGPIPADA